jgi:hypothetical protein
MAMTAQEPGQTDPIGAAAFDTEAVDPPERGRPGEQFGVALVRRFDGHLAHRPAVPINRDGDVQVLMRVHPDDDIGAFQRDACHDC